MKKENINKYYTDEDLINFKKLNKFGSFKTNGLKNNKINKYPVKYSMSDNNYFNKFTKMIDKYEPAINNTVDSFEGRTSPENLKLLRHFLVGTMGAESNGNPNVVNKESINRFKIQDLKENKF